MEETEEINERKKSLRSKNVNIYYNEETDEENFKKKSKRKRKNSSDSDSENEPKIKTKKKLVRRKNRKNTPFLLSPETKKIIENFKEEQKERIDTSCCRSCTNKIILEACEKEDLILLQEAINATDKISNVFQQDQKGKDAISIALQKNNIEMLKILFKELKNPQNRVKDEEIHYLDAYTGRTGRYTYSHRIRKLNISRGGKEGNFAFHHHLEPKTLDEIFVENMRFLNKETIEYLNVEDFEFNEILRSNGLCNILETGNLEGSKTVVEILKDFGLNLLHHETLWNTDEELTKYTIPSITKKSYENLTPIHTASINHSSKYLKELIETLRESKKGIQGQKILDKTHKRPIHYAAASETPDCLEYLLNELSDDPLTFDKEEKTPLFIAIKYGRLENVKVLTQERLKESTLSQKNKFGMNAILYAAEAGEIEILKYLIEIGADVNSINSEKQTPLLLATENGHLDCVILLLKNDADIFMLDKVKKNALIYAASYGHFEILKYLLLHGLDPNSSDSSHNYPIHYAASYGHFDCLKLLKAAGANLKITNDWATNALGLALDRFHMKIADYLFSEEKEIDVNFQDQKGKTLLHLAIENNHYNQIFFLVERKNAKTDILDVDSNTLLHLFADGKAKPAVKFLIKRMKNLINQENKQKKTALDIAIKNGDYYLIELFIENGAKIKWQNIKDSIASDKWRLAGYLLKHCEKEEIEKLTEDENGDNILHLVCKSCQRRDIESFFYNILFKTIPMDFINKLMHSKNKNGISPFLTLFENFNGEENEIDERITYPKNLPNELGKEYEYRETENSFYFNKKSNDEEKPFTKETSHSDMEDQDENGEKSMNEIQKEIEKFEKDINLEEEKMKKEPQVIEEQTGKSTKTFVNFLRILFENLDININDTYFNPKNKFKHLRNALHYSCLSLNYGLTKFLLEMKIDSKAKTGTGANALHLYMTKRKNLYGFKFEDLLLSYGLNFNDLDHRDRNCLFYLFIRQRHDPIEFLSDVISLIKDLNLQQVNKKGRTILHQASKSGAVLCCMYLLERKIPIDLEDHKGETALTLSLKHENSTNFPIILINKGANPFRGILWSNHKVSVFYYCLAIKKWYGLAYWLLEIGMDPINAINDAITSESYQTLFSLLSKTSTESLKEINSNHQNVVHLIAKHNTYNKTIFNSFTDQIVEMLKRKEIPLNLEDVDQRTPIFYACEKGYLELTKKLIPHSNLKHLDKDGNSLLHLSGSLSNTDLFILLLSQGLDPNIQNKEKKNVLLYFSENCQFEMINLLFKHSKVEIDTNVQDIKGKTSLHLLIGDESLFGRFRDLSIINLLLDHKVDVNIKDNGNPPIYYAQFQKDKIIFNLLLNHGAKDYKQITLQEPIEPPFFSPDFEKDSDELYQNLLSKVEVDNTPIPDKNAELDSCKVHQKDGHYFDILLNKTDVSEGLYGIHNFYKMQIIFNHFQKIYILFNRWGRIGEKGRFQKTPFSTPEAAEEEFKKIFKSKTGNLWEQRDKFEKKKDKYLLTNSHSIKTVKIEGFNKNEMSRNKLIIDEKLANILKELFDLTKIQKSSKFDYDDFPLGGFTKDRIEKGIDILNQILPFLNKDKEDISIEQKKSNIEKIVELSNEFYELLPFGNFSNSVIKPIDSKYEYLNIYKKLIMAKDISLSLKIILGARKNLDRIHPLDYCYQSLENHISHVTSIERDIIHSYIKEYSKDSITIFRLNRKGENERFKKFETFDNRVLLWHGSKKNHFIGILKRGLHIKPIESEHSGSMFGKGIYFSDQFKKSFNYCYGSNINFMILCEVALGKIYSTDKTHPDYIKAPDGFDSVQGVGKKGPKLEESFFLKDGSMIPCGKIHVNDSQSILENNEYIVYHPDQVKMRYLVVIQ